MKALRIEIEGTDGAGKTTGLKYLIAELQKKGQRVLETREVGSPLIPVCVKMRETVLDPESGMTGAEMEMVFAAMRVLNQAHYRKVEDQSDFIVSDRGWLSHLAYTDHNESVEFTEKLYTNLLGEFTELPDMILYFNVNTDTALKRRVKRGTGMDVIEMKGIEFQELVRGSFLKYIETLPRTTKVIVIDANQDIAGVQEQLNRVVELLELNVSFRKNIDGMGDFKTPTFGE